MNSQEYHKTCPECGQSFKATRIDQRYCCRKCLNSHKNRTARLKRKKVVPIDKILHRNREILKELMGKVKDGIIAKDELIFRDFNFTYHTHTLQDKKAGVSYFFVYEYGFANMQSGHYKLTKHEPSI